MDFDHEITGNTSWLATVTKLNSGAANFAGTRLDSKTEYLEMAWLLTKMENATNQDTKAQFQWAVWSFSGGPTANSADALLINDAMHAVDHGFNGGGWEILTPDGSYGQESLVDNPTATPEPASLILFGSAMLGMFIMRKRLFATE